MRIFGRKLKKSVKRKKPSSDINRFKPSNNLFIGIVIVVILAILGLVMPLIVEFSRFNTNSYSEAEQHFKWGLGEKINILFLGVDKKQNNNIFVDAAMVMIVTEESEIRIINVSPDILITDNKGNRATLRRSLIESGGELSYTINLAEEFIASPIDKYVMLEKDFFEEMGKYSRNIPVTIPKEVNDNDVVGLYKWDKGNNKLSHQELYGYMSADSNGLDDKLERQLEIYKRYTKSIDYIKVILGIKEFNENIQENLTTNFSKSEIFRLFTIMRRQNVSSMRSTYTSQNVLNELGRAGVYNVYAPNYLLIDREITPLLAETSVRLEQSVVEIQNASGQAGLAGRKSRWLTNAGAEVAHISNAPYVEEISKLYTKDLAKYPNTINEIKNIFRDRIEIVEEEYPYRHIGNIVIVVGKDY